MAENQWRWVGPDGFEYTGDLATLKAGLSEGRLPLSTMVSRAGQDGWLPATDVPELAPAGFAPAPVEPAPLPAFQVEDEAPTRRDNPIPEEPAATAPIAPVVPSAAAEPPTARVPALPAAPSKSAPLLLIVGLVAFGAFVLGGITVLVVVARTGKGDAPAATAAASAAPSASAAAPAAARACVATRPGLVARPVFGKIPLEVAAAGKGRVAVAFARTKNEAQVVVLSPDSLDKHAEKRQLSQAPVAGARPLVRADAVELVLDAEEANLRGVRSILGDKPLRIGATQTGIARSAGDGEPEVVWPLSEKDLTPMRVESNDTGHFVALRSGGLGGKVLGGWLGHDGGKKTDFLSPELAASSVGTPAPALGPSTTLLLVAAKPDEASDWQLYAGKAALGQVPSRLAPLALPGAAARISPAAFALPSGGWLLQWTEGPDAAHVVKVQRLDAELAPIGAAVTVSPQGSDAGQGRLWSDGERAVSFFLVSTGSSHELWAAPLSCK